MDPGMFLSLATQALLFLAECSSMMEAPALFLADLQADVGSLAQCKQDGVQNCRAVTINLEYLESSIKPGDSLHFISGSDISMKLQRPPSKSSSGTLSYSFSLSDGGEATVTVRPSSEPSTGHSVFASIKPLTGPVIFSVEAWGKGCNVLYERDFGYFNQFED